MNRSYLEGIKFGFGIVTVLFFVFGIVFAAGFHTSSEILPGIFQGNYTFNGSLSVNQNVTFNSQVTFLDNVTGISSVPSDAVLNFNSSSCPSSWSVYGSSTFTSDLVPTLGSNSHADGTAIGSDPTYYLAFNGANSGYGNSWSVGAAPRWIGFNFTSAKTIGQYTVQARNADSNDASYSPNTWQFQAYNGSSWVTLDSQSGQTFSSNQKRTYNSFTNTNSYNAYRLYVTSINGGAGVLIGELEFMGVDTVSCIKD